MPEPAKTTGVSKGPADRRRVPRIAFKATSVVAETGSTRAVVAQTTELSRFGCFVQTTKPYPQGTRVHLELADGGDVFTASAGVAYVTSEGMGVVFTMVESESYEVLAKWLSRIPRRSDRYSFAAAAQVKELGSWMEQVLITRDLSAGGCFVQTSVPLPKGSRIRVRIEHAGVELTVIGRVTDNVSSEGMGVEFISMETKDRVILERWLGENQTDDTPAIGVRLQPTVLVVNTRACC